MLTEKECKIFDTLIDGSYFTPEELELVIGVYGDSAEKAMNAAIYWRYGLNNLDELMEEVESE